MEMADIEDVSTPIDEIVTPIPNGTLKPVDEIIDKAFYLLDKGINKERLRWWNDDLDTVDIDQPFFQARLSIKVHFDLFHGLFG